jgi:hypothetical protein
VTKPDTRGIGLVLLDPLVTMWLGAQQPRHEEVKLPIGGARAYRKLPPAPVIFEPVPEVQQAHLDEWASWRRARARAGK